MSGGPAGEQGRGVASSTKLFTAAALALLVEEGKLGWQPLRGALYLEARRARLADDAIRRERLTRLWAAATSGLF